jgi:hypothetical protein
MDSTSFLTLVQHLTSGLSRRGALRGLLTGAFAAVGSGAALNLKAEAKQRRGRRKNKKKRILPPGARCHSGDTVARNCWRKQKRGLKIGCPPRGKCAPGYICEVPVNGSNANTYCSGGPGATCGAPNADGDDTAPFCAIGHQCVLSGSNYTCQALPLQEE